jgi:hypothetical protein
MFFNVFTGHWNIGHIYIIVSYSWPGWRDLSVKEAQMMAKLRLMPIISLHQTTKLPMGQKVLFLTSVGNCGGGSGKGETILTVRSFLFGLWTRLAGWLCGGKDYRSGVVLSGTETLASN